ncbi:MAG: rhomboid family intramembrane serine protease [Gemmatimonadaceae bacterium]|nr:rhomboid family intramembrane serine protease [Gemmatimonadaceae bacterium]
MQRLSTTVKSHATTLGIPVAVAWVSLAVNTVVGGALSVFGIQPRSLDGLRGILFAPFLHGGYAHLAANTVSFVILGTLVLVSGKRTFVRVTAIAALSAGLASWLLGTPNSVHIGASGIIFGYLGYLMLAGVFARRFVPIVISIGVTVVWGAMVWGVLPGQMGVSWQGHLGGFIGGLLAARRPGR